MYLKNAYLILFFIVINFSLIEGVAGQASVSRRPNIIVFLVDDMGWTDTSVPFAEKSVPNNKIYHTPNMQKLASMGVRFTNAYAQSLCTPSRVSLMTGMNVARHRVTNWTNSGLDSPTDAPYKAMMWPEWSYNGMSEKSEYRNTTIATPLPRLLRKSGYYTIMVGKGHFSPFGISSSNPQNIGFIESIASDAIGNPRNYYGKENFGNEQPFGYTFKKGVRGLEAYHGKDIFLTEALTVEAMKAMDKALDLHVPFFLYMSHYAIHTPIMADKRFFQKYIDEGLDSVEASYATLIEGMDKSLGDLMEYVKKREIANNTVILFMSDNGGLALNPPRKGEPFKENYPLRSGKGSLYEGGIREPMIVYWPGTTDPGAKVEQYVCIEDFFPTVLEMAQVKNYRTIQTVDGVSFVKYLKNYRLHDNSRVLTWHFPSNWGQGEATLRKYYPAMKVEQIGMGPASAIRKGDWKLIYFYGTKQVELYDVKHDISESKDLSKTHINKVKELFALLNQSLKMKGAQFPLDKGNRQEMRPVLKSERPGN